MLNPQDAPNSGGQSPRGTEFKGTETQCRGQTEVMPQDRATHEHHHHDHERHRHEERMIMIVPCGQRKQKGNKI